MKLDNGMYEIDDRPMEMRSEEEIREKFKDVTKEVLERWDEEYKEWLRKHESEEE